MSKKGKNATVKHLSWWPPVAACEFRWSAAEASSCSPAHHFPDCPWVLLYKFRPQCDLACHFFYAKAPSCWGIASAVSEQETSLILVEGSGDGLGKFCQFLEAESIHFDIFRLYFPGPKYSLQAQRVDSLAMWEPGIPMQGFIRRACSNTPTLLRSH